jgi:hypothetical protein
MERVMTTNIDGELSQSNELRDEELDGVTGGMLYLGATNPKQETSPMVDVAGLIAGTIVNNLIH